MNAYGFDGIIHVGIIDRRHERRTGVSRKSAQATEAMKNFMGAFSQRWLRSAEGLAGAKKSRRSLPLDDLERRFRNMILCVSIELRLHALDGSARFPAETR